MSGDKRALQWLSGGPLALTLLLCFSALLGAFWWLSNGGSFARAASAQAVGPPVGSRGTAVGTMARLEPLPGQSLWLARDGRAYDRFWHAQAAHDRRDADALLQAGGVFAADDGVEARVTAAGPGCFRVRLMEGERQGQEGWLPAACLHAAEGRRDF